jgi:hypothetical protein
MDDHLWISYQGCHMAERSIYADICEATEAEFGHSINPQLFRDCDATYTAIDDPKHVGIIRLVLGQKDHRTGERYYNQAGTVEAGEEYQRGILALRREIVPKVRRVRRKR